MNVNAFLQKDYENEPPSGPKKTNPIKACPERNRMGQSVFLPLLQDLYILYTLHSLSSIALAKEGQSKEKPAF